MDLSKLSDSELFAAAAMPSLIHQESGGRAGVVGPQTAYGRAEGKTQMLPATAKATAKRIGVVWRPELMTDDSPEADEYQTRLGQAYLQEGLEATGNLPDALRYYHGGPDRKLWGPKTEAYAKSVLGHAGYQDAPRTPQPASLADMSDDELMALAGGSPEPQGQRQPASVQPATNLAVSAPASMPAAFTSLNAPRLTAAKAKALAGSKDLRADDGLGFLKGVTAPVFNASGHLQRAVTGSPTGDAMARMGGAVRGALPEGLVDFIDNPQGFFDAQAEQGVRPGKLGEFVGNVAGTAWVPGGPLVQGAAGGALLSDKTDAGGVLKDAAIGGIAGRATAAGSDALQIGVRKLLSKAPKVMDLPALATATKAAYKAVDDSGFVIPKTNVSGLVDDFVKTVQSSALSKSAKDDAASIIQYARTLAKGDLKLSELEKLRGDIYQALVKKGGDTGRIGTAFRAQIDGIIDGVDNGLVRTARGLNTRLKKADVVTRASQSADIRAEKDYGGDYGRKIKDRLFPLIDPANQNRNLRGATPAEMAALKKVVTGTKGQNLASTVGGMLDPRRLGGKMLSTVTGATGGAGAIPTGGLSLLIPALQMGAGFGLTGAASKTARKNVKELLDLIAAGGSKQALEKLPTKASYAAEQLVAKYLRPVAVASTAPALAAARAKDRPKR